MIYVKIGIKIGSEENYFIQELSSVNKKYTFATLDKIKKRVEELNGICKIKINNMEELKC